MTYILPERFLIAEVLPVNRWLGLLVALLLVSGCVSRQNAQIVSDGEIDLATAKTFFVVKDPEDSRGIDKLIADQLAVMGYSATNGPDSTKPPGVDAVVTYVDKWWWDLTMYMVELHITVRSPKTNFPIATGDSVRTSLVRKSPPEMVKEVLTGIFDAVRQKRS